MDKELFKLGLRFLIAAGIIAGMFQGQIQGVYAGFYATVIMGIDVAAAAQAIRESQTNRSTQSRLDND